MGTLSFVIPRGCDVAAKLVTNDVPGIVVSIRSINIGVLGRSNPVMYAGSIPTTVPRTLLLARTR